MKKIKKLRKGFALVELVVVIAVIAILAGVSVGAYFGITDSANSSAADNTNKQVRDLWTMFSVSDYKDENSLYDNATDFCLRYFEENGQQDVNVNFKVNSTSTEEQILLKIETTYPTYIYIENKMIEQYSSITKSETEFNESVKNSEVIDNAFKNDDLFEIENINFNGEIVRGFKYYKVNIFGYNNESESTDLIVRKGLTVVDGEDNEIAGNMAPSGFSAFENGSISSLHRARYVYEYDNQVKGDEYDTTSVLKIDENETYNSSIYDERKYSYIVGEKDLLYVDNDNNSNINLSNYPVAFYEVTFDESGTYKSSKGVYYKSFEDYIDYNNIIIDENGFLNIEFSTNKQYTHGVILLGNTTIKNNMNIKNYHITLDIGNNHSNFENYFKLTYISKGYETVSKERLSPSERNILENEMTLNNTSNVEVRSGVILNLTSSVINVEAELMIPLGDNSTKTGFETKNASHLVNNGEINLNDNSILRSIGLTDGSGVFSCSSGSKVLEPFKLISEQGTGEANLQTTVENKYFIIPVFELDSIRCTTVINKGALYKGLISLYTTPPIIKHHYIDTTTEIIGLDNSTNCLFKIVQGSLTKSWNDINKNTVLTINENSKIIDNAFNITIGYDSWIAKLEFTLGNQDSNFSIANFDIIVKNTGILELCSNATYEFNPLSCIYIEEGGTVNLISKKTAILNFSDDQYNELISSVTKSAAQKTIFEYYKANKLEKNLINKGTINISGGAGLHFAQPIDEIGNIVDLNTSVPTTYTYHYLKAPTTIGDYDIPYYKTF